MPMGGSVMSGFGGGGLGAMKGIAGLGGGMDGWMKGLMDMLKGGDGLMDNLTGLGSLALQGYGLNKSLGIQEDQLGILKNQDSRAARADDTNFANQQFMAQQMGGLPPTSTSLAGMSPEDQVLLTG